MTQDNTMPPKNQESLTKAILEAYNRHLKRVGGNKVAALDMTIHNLKHMGYGDEEWDFIQKVLEGIKNG